MSANGSLPSAELPRAAVLRRIWERMTTIYGFPWTNRFGISPEREPGGKLTIAGDTWARALAGISDSEIASALGECLMRDSEWPPRPGEFRALCMGVPSLESVADQLITRRAPITRFGRLVWQKLRDPYGFRMADAQRQESMLRAAFSAARAAVMAGESLPPEPAAQVAQQPVERKYATDEQVAAYLDQIRAMLR